MRRPIATEDGVCVVGRVCISIRTSRRGRQWTTVTESCLSSVPVRSPTRCRCRFCCHPACRFLVSALNRRVAHPPAHNSTRLLYPNNPWCSFDAATDRSTFAFRFRHFVHEFLRLPPGQHERAACGAVLLPVRLHRHLVRLLLAGKASRRLRVVCKCLWKIGCTPTNPIPINFAAVCIRLFFRLETF